MRLKSPTLLAAAAVAGSALLLAGAASAAGQDAATGGGQVLVGNDGGAGDTIAFTAKGTADVATGQVQYVDRQGGTGQGQTVRHGTVTCLDVQGSVARLEGVWRDGGTFGLYVQDNGEGAAAADDIVALVPVSDQGCGQDPDDDNRTALARGNAQVRDAG